MGNDLYCELAYRFMAGLWYEKEQKETYNPTKLISRLKKGIKYGLHSNKAALLYFHTKPQRSCCKYDFGVILTGAL